MFWITTALLAALVPAASAPRAPSEVIKTKTAEVVVSDVRYRGAAQDYPKPFDLNYRSYTAGVHAGLCPAANDMISDPAAQTGWQLESLFLRNVGADPTRDDEETIRSKVKSWWARYGDRTICSDLHVLFDDGTTFLQELIHPNFDGYRIVDRVILRYGIPLNDVSPRDGRTVLDRVADDIDTGPADQRRQSLIRIYGTLRRFGAKHRKELEQEGTVPAPAALERKLLDREIAMAEKGDARAMWDLARRYSAGDKVVPADPARAASWLEKAETSARAAKDSFVLGRIGEAYLDLDNNAKPPFAGKRSRAVDVLQAALKGDFGKESMSPFVKGDAEFALGKAYHLGIGTARDDTKALAILRSSVENKANLLGAEILLDLGRRKEAIDDLRGMAAGPTGNLPFRGATVVTWLKQQPEGLCGRDSKGYNPCD